MIDDKEVINNINLNKPFYKSNVLKNIFSIKEFENLINLRPFVNSKRVIVVSTNQEKYKWPRQAWLSDVNTWPSSLLSEVLKTECCYFVDCSKANKKINDICKTLEEKFMWPTDAHMFFSNTKNIKEKGLGKHNDKSHNLIVQVEGQSSLQVWSENDDLIIDEIMKPSDVVFIPRGINHKILGLTKRLSISFVMNNNSDSFEPQDRTWIKLDW